jgi:hypothetical protein
MSTAQWILNLALLAWVLLRNVGTRPVTRATFLVPLLVVAVAVDVFLGDLPTAGNDLWLEMAGAATGLLLGVLAALLSRVDHREDVLVVRAGLAFAGLWVIVIGGRVAFAEWATHAGARSIGEFSMRHQITGADAWTAAFVLLAVAMVLARLVVTGVQARLVGRALPGAGVVSHSAGA